MYEVFFARQDPTVVERVVARPAIGATSHEGMRFDSRGNLYSISERTPGYRFKFVPDRTGDRSADIWVAAPAGDGYTASPSVVRSASRTDCEAEPTGLYFDRNDNRLFVNIQHRGGDMLDKTLSVVRTHR